MKISLRASLFLAVLLAPPVAAGNTRGQSMKKGDIDNAVVIRDLKGSSSKKSEKGMSGVKGGMGGMGGKDKKMMGMGGMGGMMMKGKGKGNGPVGFALPECTDPADYVELTPEELAKGGSSFYIYNKYHENKRIAQWGTDTDKSGRCGKAKCVGTYEQGFYLDQLWTLEKSINSPGYYYMKNADHTQFKIAKWGSDGGNLQTGVYKGTESADSFRVAIAP